MTDVDFREKVLQALARLETKMDAVVGTDGNDGRLAKVEAEVRSLKGTRNFERGAIAAIGGFWTIAVVAFEYFVHRR